MHAFKQDNIVRKLKVLCLKKKHTNNTIWEMKSSAEKILRQQSSLPIPVFLGYSMPSLVFISLRAFFFFFLLTDVYSFHWCLFKSLPIYLKSAHTEC